MSEIVAATIDVSSLTKRTSFISILIIGLLFFIFGFVSWVNAILIPYFRIACELTNFQSYLVTFAFYISYFVMSVPSSFLLKKVGFKKGMMAGFWTMALGAFIFVPAALLPTVCAICSPGGTRGWALASRHLPGFHPGYKSGCPSTYRFRHGSWVAERRTP